MTSSLRSPRPALADVVAAGAEAAGAAIVPAPARAALVRAAGRLSLPFETTGFEVRLAGAPAVDLGIGWRPTHAREADLEAWEAGRRLARFVERWSAPGAALAEHCPFVFLELDAASFDAGLAPSVFVALDWPLGDTRRDGTLAAAREALALLGASPPPDVDAALATCFTAAPRTGGILHIGAMLARPHPTQPQATQAEGTFLALHRAPGGSRPGEHEPAAGGAGGAVRLSVVCPPGTLAGFLRAVAAPAATEVEALAARHLEPRAGAQIDLDLVPGDARAAAARPGAPPLGVAPRIGLGVAPADDAGWDRLLARLEADGLCEPARARALRAWPGETRVPMARRPLRGVMERYRSHVKLAVAPGVPPEAKAYLGLRPRYASPESA